MITELWMNASTYGKDYGWYSAPYAAALQSESTPSIISATSGRVIQSQFQSAFLFRGSTYWGIFGGPFVGGGADRMGRELKTKLILKFAHVAEAAAALAGMLENWWQSSGVGIAQIGSDIQRAIDNPGSPQRLLEDLREICQTWCANTTSNPVPDVLTTDTPLIAHLAEPRITELCAYLRTAICLDQLSTAPPESVPVVAATKVVAQNLAGVWRALTDQAVSRDWIFNAYQSDPADNGPAAEGDTEEPDLTTSPMTLIGRFRRFRRSVTSGYTLHGIDVLDYCNGLNSLHPAERERVATDLGRCYSSIRREKNLVHEIVDQLLAALSDDQPTKVNRALIEAISRYGSDAGKNAIEVLSRFRHDPRYRVQVDKAIQLIADSFKLG